MILLYKKINPEILGIYLWSLKNNKKLNFVLERSLKQPFDMLVNKKMNDKLIGISNIYTYLFNNSEHNDFILWVIQNNLKSKNNLNFCKNMLDSINLENVSLIKNYLHFKITNDNDKQIWNLEKLENKTIDVIDKFIKKNEVNLKDKEKDKKKVPQIKKAVKKDPVPVKKIVQNEVPEFFKKIKLKTNYIAEDPNISNRKNILITSALPYVNNEPHLGNLIGAVLSADVFSRFSKLMNNNTIYICGTDEHGTASEIKALKMKKTPKEICDEFHLIHKKIYDNFDIEFDHFGRTSHPKHKEIVQDMFHSVNKNNFINKNEVDEFFCKNCNKGLADRFIQGTCPHCEYEDCYGDQCDKCHKLLTPKELNKRKCIVCTKEPSEIKSNHLFLDLNKLQKDIGFFIENQQKKGFWTKNSISISNSWLNMGLRERCITRDLSWGVPVPLEGYEKKCFYVWFDAPIGYISITAQKYENWKNWWKNNDKVKLYQFMGKDNVPFHTVMFPGTILASKEDWTLLHHINTTEYLNYENAKFSKSKGIGIFGGDVMKTNIPIEVWRYYLLSSRPETGDAMFLWDEFILKNNSEWISNLGNLINRVSKFAFKNVNDKPILEKKDLSNDDLELLNEFYNEFKNYINIMESVKIRDGLRKCMEISSILNKYIQNQSFWDKNCDKNKVKSAIGVLLSCFRLLGACLEPFMPSFSAKLYYILNDQDRTADDSIMLYNVFKANDPLYILKLTKPGKLNQPHPIFTRLEEEEINKYKTMFGNNNKETINNI